MNHCQPNTLNKIIFKTSAQLFSDNQFWDTSILHLSLQSVTLTSPEGQTLEQGDIFRLNIPIQGAGGISMSIQVIQFNEETFEAQWSQIDMESFAILKRTIELNSQQQNSVREDIKILAGQS